MRGFSQTNQSVGRLRTERGVRWQYRVAATLSVLLLAGCGSIKITGVVTDAKSGHPVANCMAGVPGRFVQTDSEGRYTVTTRPWKDEVEFSAVGYLPRAVKFTRTNRYPVVNTELQPESSLKESGVRFDPYTGEPLAPRFDPYTGKPLPPPRAR